MRLLRDESQLKWLGKRVTAVVLGGLRLVAVYQPSKGMDEEEMRWKNIKEKCRISWLWDEEKIC